MLVDLSAGMWIKKAQPPSMLPTGIHCLPARKYASEGSTLVLKLKADVTTSSEQGYHWINRKDLCPPKMTNCYKLIEFLTGCFSEFISVIDFVVAIDSGPNPSLKLGDENISQSFMN